MKQEMQNFVADRVQSLITISLDTGEKNTAF